jgi:hypothetical protein
MIAGAVSFCPYPLVSGRLMMRNRLHATWATSSALIVWVICTVGLWAPVLH